MLVLVTVAAAAVIVMVEIDTILGSVVVDGRSHTLASIFGPFGGWSAMSDALADWATFSGSVAINSWVVVYSIVDILFIATYTGLLFGLRKRVGNPWTPPTDRRSLVGRLAIVVLAAVDLVEDGLAIYLSSGLPDGADVGDTWIGTQWVTYALFGATLVKRIAAAVVIGSIVYGIYALQRHREFLRKWGLAAKMQRFSLLVLALATVLMIISGPPILNQVPDIVRTWFLDEGSWPHFVLAAAAFLMLSVLLVIPGNLRTARAREAYSGVSGEKQRHPKKHHEAWPVRSWIVTGFAYFVVVLVLYWIGWVRASLPVVAAVALVPIAIGVIDLLVRNAPEVEPNRPGYLGAAGAVRVVGDLVAVAVLCVLGLSMVRAYTVPAILDVDRGAAIVGIVIGILLALGVWIASSVRIARRYREALGWDKSTGSDSEADSSVAGAKESKEDRRLILVLMGAASIVVLPLLVLPQAIGGKVGVLGVFAWGLSALTLILAVLALLAQSWEPLRVFKVLGMDTTPMITILLLVVLVAPATGMFGGAGLSHRIREPSLSAVDQETALRQWQSRTFGSAVRVWLHPTDPIARTTCTIPAGVLPDGRSLQVRPMIFVAATGGGIRAAWWTVQVGSRLTGWPCAEQSVIAASGASGGAVGLALMYGSTEPVADVRKLSAAGPLAEATEGLVLRDTVAGFTGVEVAVAGADDADRFSDRAALMEQAWERAVPSLANVFPGESLVPWSTFLNSTSARTGCRVVISDVNTAQASGDEAGTDAAGADVDPPLESTDCERNEGDSGVPGSYALFAAHPCLVGIHTSTAALLAARFPYVTPSGVVGANCPSTTGRDAGLDQSDQLIDGGYAENSGIGTLIELSAQAMPQVREFNGQQLRESQGTVVVAVPLVISIESTPQRPTPRPTPNGPVAEVAVPIQGTLRGGAMLTDPATLLEQMTLHTADWLPDSAFGCSTDPAAECELMDAIRQGADAAIPHRSILVAPRSAPGVAAPLGWVMSSASLGAMEGAMNDLVPPDCAQPKFANDLHALLEVLQEQPC